MNRQDAIERAQKLIALANQVNNRNEAAVAAAKLAKHLLEYNLSMEDIGTLEQKDGIIEDVVIFSGRNRDVNSDMLAKGLGDNMFVDTIGTWISGQPALRFIGLPDNVKTVIDLFNTLRYRLGVLTNQAFEAYKAEGGRKHGKAWKTEFFYGAVTAIRERVKEQREAFAKMVFDARYGVKTGMELIVLREGDVQAYVEKHYPDLKYPKVKRRVTDAFARGYQTGNSIDLGNNLA